MQDTIREVLVLTALVLSYEMQLGVRVGAHRTFAPHELKALASRLRAETADWASSPRLTHAS